MAKQITRARKLTPEEAAKYRKIREENSRGLAHFAESSEQNVPVPLSA